MDYKPHEYQKFCIEHIIKNKTAGLFLEMGLGKTVAALSALKELKDDYFQVGRILVIAPKNVALGTWPAEIKKWKHTRGLTIALIMGGPKARQKAFNSEADIHIINIDNIAWLIEQHGHYVMPNKKTGFTFDRKWRFDTVVLDELSGFKSAGSKRFKLLKKARPHMNRVIGLTGTPAPNSLMDLWAPMYLLDMGERLEKTVTAFRDRYFRPADYAYNHKGERIVSKYELRDGSEEAIYNAIGDICVSMKAIDHLELPEVTYKDIKIKMWPDAQKLYNELEKKNIAEYKNTVIDARSAASLSSKLHQLAQGAIYTSQDEFDPVAFDFCMENGIPYQIPNQKSKEWEHVHDEKLKALDQIIEEAAGNPVMVLYWFQHDLARLKKHFKKAKTMEGPQQIKDWNDGKIPILLLQPASAGHGLNLQFGGHIVVWFSMYWSLELYQQANARLNRQGQTKPVSINHLIVEGTIDERILDVLQGKADQQNALMEAVKAIMEK